MNKTLTCDDVAAFQNAFDCNAKNRLSLNAVTQTDINAIALNRAVINRTTHTYSHRIESPKATHQKSTGRCWIFAGLNTLRLLTRKKLNVEEFEFSQSYLMFWDKLEKANYFLENIITTRNEPLNGRVVMWLLADPIPDGGQWDMFIDLIEKYGVVPQTAMPETHSSSSSRTMNNHIVLKLREGAHQLRTQHESGASEADLRKTKTKILQVVHRMLSMHLGTPPQSFMWQWRDKDKKFHRGGTFTPHTFYAEYVNVNLNDYVCLINAPTQDKPFNKLYTVQYLGNVVGGHPVRYLNVDINTLKDATANMIKDGDAVWFGCDVGKMFQRDKGILDPDIYDYDLVYDTTFPLDKADRLNYGHSRMTHAMVLTGVDISDEGTPTKWRVENSWGIEHGDKGYEVMTDAWFDEYLYEVTVHKKYLSDDLLKVLDTEATVLPPWDPMGALAKA